MRLRRALTPPRQDELFEPETAISFGQAYLDYLLQNAPIGGNLIFVAAAYNAGPGSVQAAGGNIAALPQQTQTYVAQISADVPAVNA